MVIEIHPNSEIWWEHIRHLRNDERVKHGFIQQDMIPYESHIAYMQLFSGYYLIATVDGKFAGYAGAISGDIRVCVEPEYQGKGVGVRLIEAVMERFGRAAPKPFAKVKIENEASKKLFEKCGFKVKYVIMEKDDGSTQSI